VDLSDFCVVARSASGYVAGHCMLRLLHDGYRVRGTLRSLQRAGEVRQWLTKARGGIDPGDALSFVEAELTVPFTLPLPPTIWQDEHCPFPKKN
jgi:dihydroflavonol-4-reductase